MGDGSWELGDGSWEIGVGRSTHPTLLFETLRERAPLRSQSVCLSRGGDLTGELGRKSPPRRGDRVARLDRGGSFGMAALLANCRSRLGVVGCQHPFGKCVGFVHPATDVLQPLGLWLLKQ
jgi:hypothetical protein